MANSCRRWLSPLAMAVTLWPACADAQTPVRSFADLVGIVRADETIIITNTVGDRVKGTLVAVDENSLSLSTDGRIQTFAKGEVSSIRLPDGVGDGALIGAATGVGAAVGILGILGARDGYVLPSAKVGAPLLLSGIGAVVGALIDRAHDRGRILYLSSSGLAQP